MKPNIIITITIPAFLSWIYSFPGVILMLIANGCALAILGSGTRTYSNQKTLLESVQIGLAILAMGHSLYFINRIAASLRRKIDD